MKKTILSLAAISTMTFANSYTDAESLLKDLYKLDFKCSSTECITINGEMKGEIDSIKMDKWIFSFRKELDFKYDINAINKIVEEDCPSTVVSVEECKLSSLDENRFKLLHKLISQAKEVSIYNIIYNNFEKKETTTVEKLSVKINKDISKLKEIEFDNLTLKDLELDMNVLLKNVISSKKVNLLEKMKMYLPKDSSTSLSDKGFQEIKRKNISEINNKLIIMYTKLSEKINENNNYNIEIELTSKEEQNKLILNTGLSISDKVSGNTDIKTKFTFNNILEQLKISLKNKTNPLLLLSIIGMGTEFNEASISSSQNFLKNINNELLSTDKEYQKNYEELIVLIDNEIKNLSFYEKFQYNLLSLKYNNLSIKAENEKKLNMVLLFQLIKEKGTLKITEEYK